MAATDALKITASTRTPDQASDHVRMHADHLQWFSENSLWRDDIATWQREADDAIRQLGMLHDVLETHNKKLRQHAASIRLHEQRQAEHESALARFESGAGGEELIGMARAHQVESSKQAEQRDFHETLKRRHHELIARFHTFVRSIAGREGEAPTELGNKDFEVRR